MRLLIMTQAFPPEIGGIQTYAYEHARCMNRYCEWVGVICPARKGDDKVDRNVGYTVFRIQNRRRIRTLAWFWELPKFLKSHPVDIILNTQWQLAIVSILARKFGMVKKVVIAAHGTELFVNPLARVPVLGSLYNLWKRFVFRNADHFYPVSDYTAGRLREFDVAPDRMTVVINGTDPEKFFPSDSSGLKNELGLENKKIILSICRLDPVKGLDQVIRVLPEVVRGVPEAHYLVVGSGPDRKRLQNLIEQMGVGDHVTFTGGIDAEELNRYYNLGDLFVMPSRATGVRVEGFGIVFLEANACEIPVIGSDLGGIPSAIVHNETGYVVPDGDLEQLKLTICDLLRNDELRADMGRKGRARVVEEANWDQVSKKLFIDLVQRFGY